MVPVWNKTAKEFVDKGELVVVGMIQEQHPERCRLYAQWKKLDWTIVYDQMNVLGIKVVPVPILIDEHGVVQNTRPKPKDLASFVKKEFPKPSMPEGADKRKVVEVTPLKNNTIDAAIERYTKQSKAEPKNAIAKFRLGVALRAKFDSASGEPNHFQQAANQWTAALKANPNQYIWRRRIEQYGPRLAKPYPFYDWVEQATKEIKSRGEKPVELQVALAGAEIAKPNRTFTSKEATIENPDPDGKIDLDSKFVTLKAAAVPSYAQAGKATRIHVVMAPEKCKWNNESEPVKVWIDNVSGGAASERAFVIPNPGNGSEANESQEMRTAEFEFKADKDATECEIGGFVLYNICDSETGQCVLKRQNFSLKIPVQARSKRSRR